MKTGKILRRSIDFLMSVLLLCLMCYSRVGETLHEWLGLAITALFIAHHIINRKWIKSVFKGKYNAFRTVQTVLNALIFLTMIGSAVSGIILSKHIFKLELVGISSLSRTVHMLCGYWNFALMSLHLGLHWGAVIGFAQKKSKPASSCAKWIARISAIAASAYGLYAIFARQTVKYMFGVIKFAYFDLTEPLIFFFIDYICIMAMFVFIGHCFTCFLKNKKGQKNHG
ncbi:MAG: DUF4405 domain-containing protein [Clostridia bacterium]|nr:DUF4405 domain-containing protein [Clostridia bacterium]